MAPAAFFLKSEDGPPGQRFCIFHAPVGTGDTTPLAAVVYLHPFAEEMNKSRRMAALQARALAQAGHAVLQIDLHGCGDSSGDFGDADWESWLADVQRACAWLRTRTDAPLWLWGLRSGCLLATEAASRIGEPVNLLFWQPVLSGKQYLQQFLRLKTAGEMLGGESEGDGSGGNGTSPGGGIAALRLQLAQGEAVEVAGYRLSPGLAAGLERAELAPPAGATRVEWLEVAAKAEPALLPVSTRRIEQWQAAGHRVRATAVNGPAFWMTSEIAEAPALIEASVAAIMDDEHLDSTDSSPLAPAGAPEERVIPAMPGWQKTPLSPRGRGAGGEGGGAPPAALMRVSCDEEALQFDCQGERLLGVLSRPQGVPETKCGVLIVVGGPQYRVGSHRQFALLARALGCAGFPVMRFDYRGMGDSEGAARDFEAVSEDIAAALDALQRACPDVDRVVLWGLCDAASAALLYCHERQDARVAGLCLLNPWVRSAESLARTHVKHYYGQRLLQADFWRKLLSGGVPVFGALRGLWRTLRQVRVASAPVLARPPFQARMAEGLRLFPGPVLLLLSGCDFVAQEFSDRAGADATWRTALQRDDLTRQEMSEADHTFSSAAWRHEVENRTLAWLRNSVR